VLNIDWPSYRQMVTSLVRGCFPIGPGSTSCLGNTGPDRLCCPTAESVCLCRSSVAMGAGDVYKAAQLPCYQLSTCFYQVDLPVFLHCSSRGLNLPLLCSSSVSSLVLICLDDLASTLTFNACSYIPPTSILTIPA
jgi:hypothetical protein